MTKFSFNNGEASNGKTIRRHQKINAVENREILSQEDIENACEVFVKQHGAVSVTIVEKSDVFGHHLVINFESR